ncbi:MAG: glycosyltransferase [Candidatus Krumholzibacteriia bacterium]
MIRILHVITQLDRGGAERQLLALVRGLPAGRFEQEVVALRAGGALAPAFQEAGCAVRALDRRDHGGPIGQFLALVRLLRRRPPDILQTWLVKANHVGRLAACLSGQTPVLATLRDMGYQVGPGDALLERLLAAGTSRVIHNSVQGRNAYLARVHDPGRAWQLLLPNGVDAERYRPDPAARERVRAALGVGPDDPVVIMVARLHPIKDPRLFLAVGRKVRQNLPAARFWLVGDGDLGPDLRRWLATEPDPGLWMAGDRDDVPALLAAADLALLTSRSEGLSNMILESMAVGLPVLATAAGGNAELVREGETGQLLPSRDPDAIAERVEQLLQNPGLARELGKAGRRRVETDFSLALLAERSIGIYERLIEGA